MLTKKGKFHYRKNYQSSICGKNVGKLVTTTHVHWLPNHLTKGPLDYFRISTVRDHSNAYWLYNRYEESKVPETMNNHLLC